MKQRKGYGQHKSGYLRIGRAIDLSALADRREGLINQIIYLRWNKLITCCGFALKVWYIDSQGRRCCWRIRLRNAVLVVNSINHHPSRLADDIASQFELSWLCIWRVLEELSEQSIGANVAAHLFCLALTTGCRSTKRCTCLIGKVTGYKLPSSRVHVINGLKLELTIRLGKLSSQ